MGHVDTYANRAINHFEKALGVIGGAAADDPRGEALRGLLELARAVGELSQELRELRNTVGRR